VLWLLAVLLFTHCPEPLLNANCLPPPLVKMLLYQTTGRGGLNAFLGLRVEKHKTGDRGEKGCSVGDKKTK